MKIGFNPIKAPYSPQIPAAFRLIRNCRPFHSQLSAALLFVPCLISAQTPGINGTAGQDKIYEFSPKIERTAAAMGISFAENPPVYAGHSFGATGDSNAAYKTFAPAKASSFLPPPVSMPEDARSAAAAPYSGEQKMEDMVDLYGHRMSLSERLAWARDNLAVGASVIAQKLDGANLESWEAMSLRHIKAVKEDAGVASRKAGAQSLLNDPRFIRELENLSGSEFETGNNVKLFMDGEESFAARYGLIRGAKKSVHIVSWAFHDDITGNESADMLIQAHKKGVKVKIIVDGLVADHMYGKRVISRMETAGIEVARYHKIPDGSEALHCKMMLVDGTYAIIGSRNFGDAHSHRNPNGPKLRDTDALFSGPAMRQAKKEFIGLWNSLISARYPKLKPLPESIIQEALAGAGGARLAVIRQSPGINEKIYLGILKAMYGATRTINIEHGYFIAIPSLKKAIFDARERGVEVNILTNSADSLGTMPGGSIFAVSILKSMPELMAAGANVYLMKKGPGLHSKFMTVDGLFADIGSFNLHPRSMRYDMEIDLQVLDKAAVSELDSAFAADIAKARKINTPSELNINETPVSSIVNNNFFDWLSPGELVDVDQLATK